jgi:hypothetical protein
VAVAGCFSAPGSQDRIVIEIPIDTVARGAPGTVHVLTTTPVAPEDVGRECAVAAEGTNNESVHPNTDLLVRSDTGEVVLADVERAPNVRTEATDTHTVGTEISVAVRLGPDGVFSGGLVVDLDCPPPLPPPIVTPPTQGEVRLRATLSGDQEVPPADPDGTGQASVEFTPAEGQVCFVVSFENIGTPNRGHIHAAPVGVNGAIVVEFFELAENPADPRHDVLETGHLEGCVPASESILRDIAANPGGFYVNLHNARFPAGAIRGQLEA